jgi:hypothetical protein
VALRDEIAETILPETATPGAKAAKTGALMALMVTDAYMVEAQQVFRAGLGQLDVACEKAHGVAFMQATPAQRLAVIELLDASRRPRWTRVSPSEPGAHRPPPCLPMSPHTISA